ncbi:MAG: hypothetical protein LBJ31_04600 [Treponema sp.]|nr:hypothetical protein [Treponema sp.]
MNGNESLLRVLQKLNIDLVSIPNAIAGLSDFSDDVIKALQYRSYELYRWYPQGHPEPKKPVNYPANWQTPQEPVKYQI